MDDEPQATNLSFRADRLELSLADGRRISVPLEFYPSLGAATPRRRRAWAYRPYATAIEWSSLDLQLSVESVVAGKREHVPPPGFRERMEAEGERLGLRRAPGN